MEGIEVGSKLDTFLCYLNIGIAYGFELNFSKKTDFPRYYMIGWTETLDLNDIEDLMVYVDLSPSGVL